jgi:hypothetical protein
MEKATCCALVGDVATILGRIFMTKVDNSVARAEDGSAVYRTRSRRTHRIRATALLLAQALALQPFVLGSTDSWAQACGIGQGDAGEGFYFDASPSTSSGEDAAEDGPESPNESEDSPGEDGGDEGDGGGNAGSPTGTDSSGGDRVSGWEVLAEWRNRVDSMFSFGSGNLSGLEKRERENKMPLPELNLVADPIDVSRANKRHVQVDYVSVGQRPCDSLVSIRVMPTLTRPKSPFRSVQVGVCTTTAPCKPGQRVKFACIARTGGYSTSR